MSSSPKTILVFGATGNIGRALIEVCRLTLESHSTLLNPKELSKSTHNDFSLIALSRNVRSATSTHLAALPRVTVKPLPADGMDKPAAAIAALGYKKGDIYGVFSCQGYVSQPVDTAQGMSPYVPG
jgi:hypothetical protein